MRRLIGFTIICFVGILMLSFGINGTYEVFKDENFQNINEAHDFIMFSDFLASSEFAHLVAGILIISLSFFVLLYKEKKNSNLNINKNKLNQKGINNKV